MPSNIKKHGYQSQLRQRLSRIMTDGDAPIQEINVGARLQALRQEHGLSQRTLAEMSGLNFNTLSMIETQKTSPNVSTLQQIASALAVPITAFFESPSSQASVVFQKSGQRPSTAFPQGTLADLGGGLSLGEGTPLLMTLDPGSEYKDSPLVHTGQEFIYCLSGEMVFWLGAEEYHLESGDSLIFEAQIPHCWANRSDKPARVINIICPSDREDRMVTQHLPERSD